MKKLILLAALVCGALFMCSCEKDNEEGRDPVVSLISYIGEPYSVFVADCKKAGYVRTFSAMGSGGLFYAYVKGNNNLTAIPDADKNCGAIGRQSEATFTTGEQLANNFKTTYNSFMARYQGAEEIEFYTLSGSNSTNYQTLDEFCAAIKAQSIGYFTSCDFSFEITYRQQKVGVLYEYVYDEDSGHSAIMEVYSGQMFS